MKIIYLDNNATTMTAPEVAEAMAPYWSSLYGNPSSAHSFGRSVKRDVEDARAKVAALINASPEEIIFTSGGSESNNTAIRGVVNFFGKAKWRMITSRVEHPAVLSVFQHIRKQRSYITTELSVDQYGVLDSDQLTKYITPHTSIVSIMWANNETGVVSPIDKIVRIVKHKGVVFHTDAVQAVGKISIDVKAIPVDMLSMSAHKFHGPKGIGALYIRKGTKINPFVLGGHQENGFRAGTEYVPGIIGLGVAAELAMKHVSEDGPKIAAMRNRLERGIMGTCKNAKVNGLARLPNTLNVSFESIEGESILLELDKIGVCASSGSACNSGSIEPSHVIRAMGVPFTEAHGTIRFSLSRYTTDEEIDYVLAHLPGIIDRLRGLSPFVDKGDAGNE